MSAKPCSPDYQPFVPINIKSLLCPIIFNPTRQSLIFCTQVFLEGQNKWLNAYNLFLSVRILDWNFNFSADIRFSVIFKERVQSCQFIIVYHDRQWIPALTIQIPVENQGQILCCCVLVFSEFCVNISTRLLNKIKILPKNNRSAFFVAQEVNISDFRNLLL